MKKILILAALTVTLCSNLFGFFIMNVMADEQPGTEMVSYYTSIQIKPGDTLWSIAEEYTAGTDISVDDYVLQLKQMNHMGEDTIHAGRYLTVMYQRPAE